jgi:hypothetical protein
MSSPNIVNVTSIVGLTSYISISNVNTNNLLLSNSADSNKVIKVNTIMAVADGGTNVNVTVKLLNQASGVGSSISLATDMTVPAGASVVVVAKDNPFYLEEDKSLMVSASSANNADILISYEEIS